MGDTGCPLTGRFSVENRRLGWPHRAAEKGRVLPIRDRAIFGWFMRSNDARIGEERTVDIVVCFVDNSRGIERSSVQAYNQKLNSRVKQE